MPLPDFKVTKYKDGREVPWFRDTQGKVRTTERGLYNWTRAEQVHELTQFGLMEQLGQVDAGQGSNGQTMKPLAAGYARWKQSVGLPPKRDLRGVGGRPVVTRKNGQRKRLRSASHMQGRGHMLDDVRVNYVDDRKGTITISNEASRIKARANERRSPWWGWNPASINRMRQKSAELFGTGMAERLFEARLIGASALAFATAQLKRGTSLLRRAA
jgi:hypothetical protein